MTAETFFSDVQPVRTDPGLCRGFLRIYEPARISGRRYHAVRRCADRPERAVAAADGFSERVVAGVLGSLVIYAVCYWGGEPVMEKLFGRSKKFKSLVRKCHEFIDAQHGRGLAIIRVIPCIRTIVSIPAGLLRMPVKWFVGWSAAGITVWNTALISFGYFFSEKILSMVM